MNKTVIHNERELLSGIAIGNETAFRSLMQYYYPFIYNAAFRMTGNAVASEDIVQDTFLKVWAHREELPEKNNFGGWLYRIAENNIFNALSRMNIHRRYYQQMQHATPEYYLQPDIAIEQKESDAIFQRAVSSLPPKQHQTFQLIKIKGLSRKEAAGVMNISPDTVKSNLELAIRSIRAFCLRTISNKSDLLLLLFYFLLTPPKSFIVCLII